MEQAAPARLREETVVKLPVALILVAALAACGQAARLEVKDVWARDTVGSTANAAVYMTIASPAADRLVGASAPVAKKTDLMTMETGGGAMGMTYLEAIEIPANEAVSLNPRGLHVWLADLDEPLRAGRTFPLVLEFEKAGEHRVEVSIIAPAAAPPMSAMGM
jgi:hypothetical protein